MSYLLLAANRHGATLYILTGESYCGANIHSLCLVTPFDACGQVGCNCHMIIVMLAVDLSKLDQVSLCKNLVLSHRAYHS